MLSTFAIRVVERDRTDGPEARLVRWHADQARATVAVALLRLHSVLSMFSGRGYCVFFSLSLSTHSFVR